MSKACILKPTLENIEKCGDLIDQGDLVAFPTETVYGLGANALNFESVLKIYQTKERPLTDPVIVHVSNIESSLALINPSSNELRIYKYLAENFWPGPLTLVIKHSSLIHPSITANTGFVGIRIPAHPLALALISKSNVPIAAPSANMFNHVSPTTAAHVFNDFFDKNVTILDDGKTTLGIESTVLRIDDNKLSIFRLGSLPLSTIENCLSKVEEFRSLKIEIVKKIAKETEIVESPGQFIKHYSPNVPSFLLTKISNYTNSRLSNYDLSKGVIIDIGDFYIKYKESVLGYFNLSEKMSMKETMYNFYYLLREAENVLDCSFILIINLPDFFDVKYAEFEYLDCIADKMFRSCSGNYIFDDLK